MMLTHFQRCGHRPVALVGGATGMVGDPSGKAHRAQPAGRGRPAPQPGMRAEAAGALPRFLGHQRGRLVNNYDWFKDMGFLRFIREVGKHITVNYMMAKDSVKNRLETGCQLHGVQLPAGAGLRLPLAEQAQGLHLQMGGSDQWGNITTGTELIRRMGGGEAYAITTQLLTKADGTKFGKSEGGNVWLDAARTSPTFYQFWLNAADADAARMVAIFTPWSQAEVAALTEEHAKAPHLRQLQKELAAHITTLVHGKGELDAAIQASTILFGYAAEGLGTLSERQWLDVFDGVPQAEVARTAIEAGLGIVDLLSESTGFLPSKGEARRALKEGSISVNKVKVDDTRTVNASDLINGKFILLQRGKKNYFLVKVG
jgi:tyrosyl-tRNA synthetase